jgi:DNA polymerase III gamma/tau subunit
MPLKTFGAVDIYKNLKWVLDREGLESTEGFLQSLSCSGIGSLRDVQQVLEQAILYSGIGNALGEECLVDIAGIIPTGFYRDMAAAICSQDLAYFLSEINRWYFEGRDLKQLFLDGLSKLFRDFASYLVGSGVDLYSGIPEESLKSNLTLDLDMVRFGIRLVGELYEFAKDTSNDKVLWEVFAVRFFEGLKVNAKA